jgi:hypothetical protein
MAPDDPKVREAVEFLQAQAREGLRSGNPRRQRRAQRRLDAIREAGLSGEPPTRVYVLRSPAGVKVGISQNPDGRAAAINATGPHPVELVESWPAPSRRVALDIEASVLSILGPYRLNGEWLDRPVEEVVELVQAEVIRFGEG